jgi:hypothetical protein
MSTMKQIDAILPFLDRFTADGFSVGTWHSQHRQFPGWSSASRCQVSERHLRRPLDQTVVRLESGRLTMSASLRRIPVKRVIRLWPCGNAGVLTLRSRKAKRRRLLQRAAWLEGQSIDVFCTAEAGELLTWEIRRDSENNSGGSQ